ncbi:MAG: T9SS type A sorting domain-containing protein, partial [Bacteroidota bacterium]
DLQAQSNPTSLPQSRTHPVAKLDGEKDWKELTTIPQLDGSVLINLPVYFRSDASQLACRYDYNRIHLVVKDMQGVVLGSQKIKRASETSDPGIPILCGATTKEFLIPIQFMPDCPPLTNTSPHDVQRAVRLDIQFEFMSRVNQVWSPIDLQDSCIQTIFPTACFFDPTEGEVLDASIYYLCDYSTDDDSIGAGSLRVKAPAEEIPAIRLIYPAPHQLILDINHMPQDQSVQEGEIRIWNALGQQVIHQVVTLNGNQQQIKLTTHGLKPGLYILELKAGTYTQAVKFIQ